MENILGTLDNWSVALIENKKLESTGAILNTIDAIKSSEFSVIPAKVPGNIELDMIAAGIIDFDIYFGNNIIRMQDYENLHAIYFTTFDAPDSESKICFDGIDTVADIYLNGALIGSCSNMYISYEFPLKNLRKSGNELVVHIKPVMIEERKYSLPAVCNALEYGYSSLYIRKAAHMYGWDIMPRIVSAGIYKNVFIKEIKKDLIADAFVYTQKIDVKNSNAVVAVFYSLCLSEDKTQDYSIHIEGDCKDSHFEATKRLFSIHGRIDIDIKDCKFWWPRYAGEQNLYSVKITLLYKGAPVDTRTVETGIRMVELSRTNTTDKEGNGDFCFVVNGRRIFAMGSNWVPLDPFHSKDEERLDKAFELLYDIGSNVVRCWGGNVYESDRFYSLCDKYGIMVWQDFAMGCAVYPQEDKFYDILKEEAVFIIKRLRNHPSIVLWAGDNEGDYAYMSWGGGKERNPDKNIVTRKILAELCDAHDFTRPYLPSSPYITEETRLTGAKTSEDHLWGPRDYFKGDYYKNTVCHFASETGYHACPSPESMKKFIPVEDMWPWHNADGSPKITWLAHAACMETGYEAAFSYRIKLMADQVTTLFGKEPDNITDFAKQSQISQGEAVKYYIERFRISRPRRSGIIWWNIIDGWPQFSDAIVDYYYCKKLGYHYIKRVQEPLCLMFDEPQDQKIALYAANELPENVDFEYKVTNITDGRVVLSGKGFAFDNASTKIAELGIEQNEKKFYLIEWKYGGKECKNHYFTNIIDIDYNSYMDALKKCSFDMFEGF